MTSLRKTISILLAVIMVCSAFGVMPLTASANSGEQSCPLITDIITDTKNTNTYYFYMPEEWRNKYNDNSTDTEDACPCIYWWNGTDNCLEHPNAITNESWPGYRVTETVAPNIFVAHVPKNVTTIIWNNSVDSGTDSTAPEYTAEFRTVNINSEYFDANDANDTYDFFPDGTDSFDGMIFVCDPDNIDINEFSGKAMFNGSWLYYYGNGEYGIYPTKEEAEAQNGVTSNGDFPQRGFDIDKEEMYLEKGETGTIVMKNYDKRTLFSIVDASKTSRVSPQGLFAGVEYPSTEPTEPTEITEPTTETTKTTEPKEPSIAPTTERPTEAPTLPAEGTFHVVAGDADLCNGVSWDPSSDLNLMTLGDDGVYTIIYENVAADTYNFKVTTNGAWDVADFNLVGDCRYGGPNAKITVEEDGSEVTITFKESDMHANAYINGVLVDMGATEPMPTDSTEQTKLTEPPIKAPITCGISVDDPSVASITVEDGVVTVKGLKDGATNVNFFYTIPELHETDPETGEIILAEKTIGKSCRVTVFTPPEDEPGATEDEAEYDYSLNGTGTVTVEANSTNKYIKFVPEESDTYRIFSQCHEDVEATLYDSEWEYLEHDDDDGDSLNFMIKHYLEEGQTYYLSVSTIDYFGEDDYVYCDVVFGFESDYDDDPATDDEAQNYDYENYDYELSGEGAVAVSTNKIYKYIKFVPDENESYEIYSDSDDYDTYAVLLDENGEELYSDDDSYDGDNFRIAAFLKAGKTYYVGVRRYSGSDFIDYNVTFKKTPDTPAGWLYENEIVTIGDFKYRLYFERYMADEGDYSKCYCAELIGYNGNEENVEVPESFEYDNRTVYVCSIGNYIFASNPNAGKIKTLKAPDGITYISAYALFDSEGGKRLDINLECGEYTELEEYYYDDDEFGFAVNAKYATLYGYYGSSTDIVIPAMVQGVPVKVVYDFINNEHKANVKSVTVPDTVEWISGTAFRLECYDEDLDRYSTIKSDIKVIGGENAAFGPYLFIDENDFEFYIQDNSATFIGYFGELTEIVIPSTAEGVPVEDISYDVISDKVTSVTIPDSVKYIDYHAFYVYDEEDDEYFPSKATIIGGENALVYNYSEYNEDGIRFYIGRDGEATVVGYYGFNPTLNIPDTFKGLPVTAVDYVDFGYNVNFVKNVIVPSSVKYISEYSFVDFSNLESVTLPCDLENTFFYVWNSADQEYVKMDNIIKSHTEVTDEAVAPTTTKTGLTEGSHCSVCGTVITPQQVVPKLTSLSLEKSSATVYVKGTTQINAKVANSNAKTTYTSSDTKVATVSASGKVTAKKAGKATITVTNNGVSKKFTVEVKNPKLSKKTVTVKKNKTVKVKITGKIKGVNNKYTNTKIAKITSKKSASTLKIKGLKKGNTTLKINVSGITLRLKVKVKAK